MHAQTQTEETQNVIFNNSLIAIIHCVKNLILFLSVLEISLLCTAETLMQPTSNETESSKISCSALLRNITKCNKMLRNVDAYFTECDGMWTRRPRNVTECNSKSLNTC